MVDRQVQTVYYYTQANSQLLWMADVIEQSGKSVGNALLQRWQDELALLLPQGRGEWQQGLLQVRWGKQKEEGCTKMNLTGCLRYPLNAQ